MYVCTLQYLMDISHCKFISSKPAKPKRHFTLSAKRFTNKCSEINCRIRWLFRMVGAAGIGGLVKAQADDVAWVCVWILVVERSRL